MRRVKRVKRVYLRLVIEEYRNVVLVILFISQILSVSITAAFVSQLEIKTGDIENKEILANQLDEVTTSNLITDTNTTNKTSQAENELGNKLKIVGVYVLSSTFIPLIIMFLINHLLSSLGVWRKLQMNEEWCSKYE